MQPNAHEANRQYLHSLAPCHPCSAVAAKVKVSGKFAGSLPTAYRNLLWISSSVNCLVFVRSISASSGWLMPI
jgi:hypothetical protein